MPKTLEKQCFFCANKVEAIDYKDVPTLRRYVSSYMKIAPRRRSGLCAKHQRMLSKAIKRARHASLMPYAA